MSKRKPTYREQIRKEVAKANRYVRKLQREGYTIAEISVPEYKESRRRNLEAVRRATSITALKKKAVKTTSISEYAQKRFNLPPVTVVTAEQATKIKRSESAKISYEVQKAGERTPGFSADDIKRQLKKEKYTVDTISIAIDVALDRAFDAEYGKYGLWEDYYAPEDFPDDPDDFEDIEEESPWDEEDIPSYGDVTIQNYLSTFKDYATTKQGQRNYTLVKTYLQDPSVPYRYKMQFIEENPIDWYKINYDEYSTKIPISDATEGMLSTQPDGTEPYDTSDYEIG